MKGEDYDLPLLDWIPKSHKYPCKQLCIARAAKYSTKTLFKLLTFILAVVKTGQQKYHDANFSRSGVNQMWILKHSKDLLKILFSRSPYLCNKIKTFDFSTLYINIPHAQIKSRY